MGGVTLIAAPQLVMRTPQNDEPDSLIGAPSLAKAITSPLASSHRRPSSD